MQDPAHLAHPAHPAWPALPVDGVLPALRAALTAGTRAVLQAPPGAGKTTRVPPGLLDAPWLHTTGADRAGRRRIIMLEPRRLAARMAAGYMARLLGEEVGATVGYRVRLDSRVGPDTRIEVVTEGILTRMLQDDPSLDDVGIVIFDEFHERSLHADLGLALSLQSQSLLRPDLRVLVMSATLDVEAVAMLLDDAPVIRSEGRVYDVDTIYLTGRVDGFIEPAVASTVRRALRDHDGDVLVFLPGAAEIRRTAALLAEIGTDMTGSRSRTHVLPLFGDLPQHEQDRAIAPGPTGTRKVVLATSIAETSLTIEGIRVVIDSGLMRVPRFSPRTGMTRLTTVPVSRAAADQRRGRAGRLGPGVCYRLWTEGEHAGLIEHRPAEILEADLAPLALELAAWGTDAAALRWIDPPPAASLAQARELLRELDAIDAAGSITPHGRELASLALHPRLAHMLLRASSLGLGPLACDLAALLTERDVFRSRDGGVDPDLRLRLPLMRGERSARFDADLVDHNALRRTRSESRLWQQRLGLRHSPRARRSGSGGSHDDDNAGLLLAFAYPDRIAQQRGGRGRFVLRNGRGAAMDPHHALAGDELIVVADVGGVGRDSRIYRAAPLARVDVERHFGTQIETTQIIAWDDVADTVVAREVRRLGALVLADRPLRDVPPDALVSAIIGGVREHGLPALNWTADTQRLRQRLAFLHQHAPDDWPDVSDEALLAALDDWFVPFLSLPAGATAAAAARALRAVDTGGALCMYVGWDRRAQIDRLAPTHVEVPSGSRIAIDYSDSTAPVLAVRLQEMFGLADTPRIADGRVPLTLHLLSPARRPVQVTRDLASFWQNAYFDVRRDLRGRYPKHYWPEDPLQAEPTRGVRRP